MKELNKSIKNIVVEKIIVRAMAGGEIGNCIREAIKIANQYWVNVELIHNDEAYIININDLISLAEKQTDNKAIHRTKTAGDF